MTDRRPDPAELLTHAQREESRAKRGRLKIFFGAAPGVGKTYAMLAAAQRLAREGVDVVIGLVETHGRSETEQQILGLDVLSRRRVEYRGTVQEEFDLDAALARRPEVLVVDELAHTNAPGGRFAKRWQDVQELLAAEISVLTTLNVQHLESLNDVVAQITGVTVRETIPDAVFEEADEVELVDLPPDALLDRLRAGRVYLPETVRHAVDSFFRKGNLTALRELALRRTAEWVDTQVRLYKAGKGIRAVWPVAERILVAVSPSPMAARLVRAAKRMSAGLHADLIAVYVETPRSSRLSQADQDRVLQTLRLAESLGAEAVTLSSARSPADELVAYARSRNVSRIVVGKTARSRLSEAVLGSFVAEVIRASGDTDIYVMRGDADEPAPPPAQRRPAPARRNDVVLRYGLALLIVGICTAIAAAVFRRLDIANVVMLYLAGVVITAIRLGRGPAVLATIVSVATLDYFFVRPYLTFAVSDVQYLITFGVMLAIGLLLADLTTRLRGLAETARDRERRTSALYAMSRELTAARGADEVAATAAEHVHETFDCDALVAVPDAGTAPGGLRVLGRAGAPEWLDDREAGVARWALDHSKHAGLGTQALPSAAGRYVSLTASQGTLGVLAVRPREPGALLALPQLLLLDTFANQIALALDRVALLEGQQRSRIEAESERMRSALLSSVSHDLRTPLATIAGAAGTLRDSAGSLDERTRRELTDSIVQESERLNTLIANLMFATRLEAGGIELNREWTTVEEVVGAGLAGLRDALAARPFRTQIPLGLPMIRVDNAMLPQVIHNLVENAIRYTPPGTPIQVSAWDTDTSVVVKVADEGPGLADEETARVFERFYRGRASRVSDAGRGGMGLGLTIAQGIVKAHGGRIWAEQNLPRGVGFLVSLPIERPQPVVVPETAGTAA